MILALDLARSTGWAAGVPCGPPLYGTVVLDTDSVPARFLQLANAVTRLIEAHGVTEVVQEAPFVGRTSNASSLMPLFGYRAAAMMAAHRKGLGVQTFTPATVRKHFIGHGGLGREDAKAAVISKCQWRGWAPANDDEADALALWDYRCALLDSRHLARGMVRCTSTSGSVSGRGSAST